MPRGRRDGRPRLDRRLQLDSVDLRPAAAQTVSLLFHELATNAGKYGALTAPSGRVTLHAAIVDEPGRAELELVWQEDGGPEVKQPTEQGFGTSVLFRAIEHQHDGQVTMEWRPAGVICTVCMPLQEVVAGCQGRGAND